MKDLPYFRWFPKDAETDESYASMSDAELGFYHHCLNFSWTNDGIPADPASRARALGRNRKQADARWTTLVAKCFKPHERRAGYLVNEKQETERLLAQRKSIKASESAKVRSERSTEKDSSCSLRAYDSDSVSENLAKKQILKAGTISKKFAEFWARWCVLTHRRQRESFACQAWLSVVEFDTEADAMACLERYGVSDEVKSGIVSNPDKWIYEQARDAFNGTWQKRTNGKSSGIVGDLERYLDEHPE